MSVRPAGALAEHSRLFASLEAAFAVRFVAQSTGASTADGALVVGEHVAPADSQTPRSRAPTLVFAGPDNAVSTASDVRVMAHPGVDRRLRDIVLLEQAAGWPLSLDRGDELLALGADGPAWTRRNGSRRVDRVFSPFPVLGDGMTLLEALHGPHSLGLVALVEFLRKLDRSSWSVPGIRCAFVFDDPNLRRNRYGYLDFRALVNHADEHGYHAAMAMVPLDARCSSEDTVAIFRDRPDRLSLVMHGNNHSADELMNARDFAAGLALSAQALRRIAVFEAKTGLCVDRVMIPPHASWSRSSARALGALGYDGLSATHSFPTTEPASAGRVLAGWTGVDFVDGCAVIPRVSLSMDRTGIALRAYLDQPLVLYGHHGDLASGLEPLAAAAALVNGLGDVQWCSVGQLVHSNHALRVHIGRIAVRPGAQRMRIVIPDGVDELVVHAPHGAGPDTGLSGWSASGADGPVRAFGAAAPIGEGPATVRLHTCWETDPRSIASPKRSVSAIVQRRLNELQDRLAPVLRPRVSA